LTLKDSGATTEREDRRSLIVNRERTAGGAPVGARTFAACGRRDARAPDRAGTQVARLYRFDT
jgi:hypothetical protein